MTAWDVVKKSKVFASSKGREKKGSKVLAISVTSRKKYLVKFPQFNWIEWRLANQSPSPETTGDQYSAGYITTNQFEVH